MLEGARKIDSEDGGYVDFLHTGAPANGEFRCTDCGYGVTVQGALPLCPMCAGTTWESALSGPFPAREMLQ